MGDGADIQTRFWSFLLPNTRELKIETSEISVMNEINFLITIFAIIRGLIFFKSGFELKMTQDAAKP